MSRSKEQPGSSGPEKAWMRSFGHVLRRDSGSTGDGTGRQTEMRKTAEKIHGRREDGWPYGGGSKPKGETEALWRSSEQKEKNAMRGDSLHLTVDLHLQRRDRRSITERKKTVNYGKVKSQEKEKYLG